MGFCARRRSAFQYVADQTGNCQWYSIAGQRNDWCVDSRNRVTPLTWLHSLASTGISFIIALLNLGGGEYIKTISLQIHRDVSSDYLLTSYHSLPRRGLRQRLRSGHSRSLRHLHHWHWQCHVASAVREAVTACEMVVRSIESSHQHHRAALFDKVRPYCVLPTLQPHVSAVHAMG